MSDVSTIIRYKNVQEITGRSMKKLPFRVRNFIFYQKVQDIGLQA